MTRIHMISGILVAALVGCTDSPAPKEPGPTNLTQPTSPPATSGSTDTTFDHQNDLDVDPFALLAQMQEDGPPEFSARLHSCPKMKYQTIGRLLASRGIDLGNANPDSAGNIWSSSDQALGVANYAARVPEQTELTTASAAKLFDIFVAAAPEIIANMPNRAECMIGGVGTQMFDASGQCTLDGISCLIGSPATLTHVQLCNVILTQASTPELGKIIAVASLAAAAHTCE